LSAASTPAKSPAVPDAFAPKVICEAGGEAGSEGDGEGEGDGGGDEDGGVAR